MSRCQTCVHAQPIFVTSDIYIDGFGKVCCDCKTKIKDGYEPRDKPKGDIVARINNNEPLTVEEILQKVFKEYDMIIRPKALVVSPRTKMALLEAEPMIEQRVVLVETPACEDTTAYLMDRKDVEKWKLGGI